MCRSKSVSQRNACTGPLAHISNWGLKRSQTGGLDGEPKRRQALTSSNCTHLTPEGFTLNHARNWRANRWRNATSATTFNAFLSHTVLPTSADLFYPMAKTIKVNGAAIIMSRVMPTASPRPLINQNKCSA